MSPDHLDTFGAGKYLEFYFKCTRDPCTKAKGFNRGTMWLNCASLGNVRLWFMKVSTRGSAGAKCGQRCLLKGNPTVYVQRQVKACQAAKMKEAT